MKKIMNKYANWLVDTNVEYTWVGIIAITGVLPAIISAIIIGVSILG